MKCIAINIAVCKKNISSKYFFIYLIYIRLFCSLFVLNLLYFRYQLVKRNLIDCTNIQAYICEVTVSVKKKIMRKYYLFSSFSFEFIQWLFVIWAIPAKYTHTYEKYISFFTNSFLDINNCLTRVYKATLLTNWNYNYNMRFRVEINNFVIQHWNKL